MVYKFLSDISSYLLPQAAFAINANATIPAIKVITPITMANTARKRCDEGKQKERQTYKEDKRQLTQFSDHIDIRDAGEIKPYHFDIYDITRRNIIIDGGWVSIYKGENERNPIYNGMCVIQNTSTSY